MKIDNMLHKYVSPSYLNLLAIVEGRRQDYKSNHATKEF